MAQRLGMGKLWHAGGAITLIVMADVKGSNDDLEIYFECLLLLRPTKEYARGLFWFGAFSAMWFT